MWGYPLVRTSTLPGCRLMLIRRDEVFGRLVTCWAVWGVRGSWARGKQVPLRLRQFGMTNKQTTGKDGNHGSQLARALRKRCAESRSYIPARVIRNKP